MKTASIKNLAESIEMTGLTAHVLIETAILPRRHPDDRNVILRGFAAVAELHRRLTDPEVPFKDRMVTELTVRGQIGEMGRADIIEGMDRFRTNQKLARAIADLAADPFGSGKLVIVTDLIRGRKANPTIPVWLDWAYRITPLEVLPEFLFQ